MKFAVLADRGYGLNHRSATQDPVDFIEAKNWREARKEFKRIWNGHFYTKAFRVTKIS